MSELCETCGRPRAEVAGNIPAAQWCWRTFMPQSDREALTCFRLGYEREKGAADPLAMQCEDLERDRDRNAALWEEQVARADRYQAEFAACKALLIAEQKRAERAEADRSAAEARAEQWALREAALVEAGIRREAEWLNEHQELTRRASEARALALREAAEAVRGMHKKLHPQGGFNTTVSECVDAIGALSPEPYYRGVDVVDCYVNGGEERPALAALPVEPARRQVTDNANALGAPSAQEKIAKLEERIRQLEEFGDQVT